MQWSTSRPRELVPCGRSRRTLLPGSLTPYCAPVKSLQAADRFEEAWQRDEAVLRFAGHLRERGDWYQQQAANEVEADAFEAIVNWAAQPSQTPDRILSALRLLESKYLGSLPSPPPNLMNRYLAAQGRLDFKPGFWPDGWRIVRIAAAIMPWELARARRIVDLRFQVEQAVLCRHPANTGGR